MTTKRDPETIRRLAAAFDEVQTYVEGERGIDVATRIAGASDPIWAAAMHWLEHREMPDEPSKFGYTLRTLTRVKGLPPSAALTALMALEADSSAALISLEHLEDRGPDAGKYPAYDPESVIPKDAKPARDYFR